MTDSEITLNLLYTLVEEIEELSQETETSMGVWLCYWRARCLLRELALFRYKAVTQDYVSKGHDAWMPSEGFKEIAADDTETMRIMRTTMEEESDDR